MKFSWICLLVAFCGIAAVAQETQTPEDSAKRAIRSKGCITAGVESGCTSLRDASGQTYTLFFPAGKEPPPMNTAIFFTGTPHQGMTTCMQGKAVDVTTWTPAKMKCAKAKTSAPAQ